MTLQQKQRERQKARKFWGGLSTAGRWDVGDALVLAGTLDWLDYDMERPSPEFVAELDRIRIQWEETR